MNHFDVLLVGGGLANGLIAARLLASRPSLRIAMLEAGAAPGGNHTWCFHEGDVSPAAMQWLAPMVAHRWRDQEVCFPTRRRVLDCAYFSISSEQFRAALGQLPIEIRNQARVSAVEPQRALLENGEAIAAGVVIDGRGQRPSRALDVRAQKFVGVEVRTAAPHGVTRPMIMDADLAQHDGYRFVYLLPFGPDRLLIEDTRYSDAMALDRAQVREDALAYARGRGWEVAEVLREEDGVLPVALAGDIAAFWEEGAPGVARSGLAAALFHPVTGYSLPDAVRLAEAVGALPLLEPAPVYRAVRELSERLWRERAYYRLLSRMLFQAAEPAARWRVMRRFYGLSEGLIRRFYAAELSAADKLRILVGKPPVPISRALACLRERPLAAAPELEPTNRAQGLNDFAGERQPIDR